MKHGLLALAALTSLSATAQERSVSFGVYTLGLQTTVPAGSVDVRVSAGQFSFALPGQLSGGFLGYGASVALLTPTPAPSAGQIVTNGGGGVSIIGSLYPTSVDSDGRPTYLSDTSFGMSLRPFVTGGVEYGLTEHIGLSFDVSVGYNVHLFGGVGQNRLLPLARLGVTFR